MPTGMICVPGLIVKSLGMKKSDSFSSQTYLNRQLIILNLRKQSAAKLNLEEPEVPFPCAFGHPVEDILKKLQKALDKTPRKKL